MQKRFCDGDDDGGGDGDDCVGNLDCVCPLNDMSHWQNEVSEEVAK